MTFNSNIANFIKNSILYKYGVRIKQRSQQDLQHSYESDISVKTLPNLTAAFTGFSLLFSEYSF